MERACIFHDKASGGEGFWWCMLCSTGRPVDEANAQRLRVDDPFARAVGMRIEFGEPGFDAKDLVSSLTEPQRQELYEYLHTVYAELGGKRTCCSN